MFLHNLNKCVLWCLVSSHNDTEHIFHFNENVYGSGYFIIITTMIAITIVLLSLSESVSVCYVCLFTT